MTTAVRPSSTTSSSWRRCVDPTSRIASTASRRPASGNCRGAIAAISSATCWADGRSRDLRVSVRPAMRHARQRRTARLSHRRSPFPGKKDGQFIYGIKPCSDSARATARFVCSTRRSPTAAPSRSFSCANRSSGERPSSATTNSAGRPSGRWILNFAKTTPITEPSPASGPARGVQPVQQPDVRRAQLQHRYRKRRLRPHQPQHDRAIQLPALHPAWLLLTF